MKHTTDSITTRMIVAAETRVAADVMARGMRDNPLHVSAFGESPAFRESALAGVFRAFLSMEAARKGHVLGAFKDNILVGVCGMMRPGCCQLSLSERIALLPKLLWNCGFRGTGRLLSQFGNWSKHDPHEPHWHLGPIGIERELQGQGMGSLLLREFCRIVDSEKMTAWLETDKEVNVLFYRKHGFEVVAEDIVNGVRNWFMERKARTQEAAQPSPALYREPAARLPKK